MSSRYATRSATAARTPAVAAAASPGRRTAGTAAKRARFHASSPSSPVAASVTLVGDVPDGDRMHEDVTHVSVGSPGAWPFAAADRGGEVSHHVVFRRPPSLLPWMGSSCAPGTADDPAAVARCAYVNAWHLGAYKDVLLYFTAADRKAPGTSAAPHTRTYVTHVTATRLVNTETHARTVHLRFGAPSATADSRLGACMQLIIHESGAVELAIVQVAGTYYLQNKEQFGRTLCNCTYPFMNESAEGPQWSHVWLALAHLTALGLHATHLQLADESRICVLRTPPEPNVPEYQVMSLATLKLLRGEPTWYEKQLGVTLVEPEHRRAWHNLQAALHGGTVVHAHLGRGGRTPAATAAATTEVAVPAATWADIVASKWWHTRTPEREWPEGTAPPASEDDAGGHPADVEDRADDPFLQPKSSPFATPSTRRMTRFTAIRAAPSSMKRQRSGSSDIVGGGQLATPRRRGAVAPKSKRAAAHAAADLMAPTAMWGRHRPTYGERFTYMMDAWSGLVPSSAATWARMRADPSTVTVSDAFAAWYALVSHDAGSLLAMVSDPAALGGAYWNGYYNDSLWNWDYNKVNMMAYRVFVAPVAAKAGVPSFFLSDDSMCWHVAVTEATPAWAAAAGVSVLGWEPTPPAAVLESRLVVSDDSATHTSPLPPTRVSPWRA